MCTFGVDKDETYLVVGNKSELKLNLIFGFF